MRLPYAAAVVEVPCNVPPRPSLLDSHGVSFIVVVMMSPPRGSPAELVDGDTDEELRSVKHEDDEAVIEVPAEMSVDATGVATLQVVCRKGLRTWRVRVKVSVLLWRAESAGARK